jgi:predicted transcriptional regulator
MIGSKEMLKMKLNDRLIRAKLLEKDVKIKDIAAEIGISQQALNYRIIKNKLLITDGLLIAKKLNIPFEQIFKEIENNG